jgi:hypothetical protein
MWRDGSLRTLEDELRRLLRYAAGERLGYQKTTRYSQFYEQLSAYSTMVYNAIASETIVDDRQASDVLNGLEYRPRYKTIAK